MIHAINILNSSDLPDEALRPLSRSIQGVFRLPVEVRTLSLNVAGAYDISRGQYNSTVLLGQVLKQDLSGTKAIVVVDVDLYVPVLTFVFGEAQLGGTAAVVSTHRLRNQYYGLQQDDELLLQRLRKEIIHELGHTFGLYHCRQFECVMRSSTYVEEIDLKREVPCTDCAMMLRNTTQVSTHAENDHGYPIQPPV